MKKIYMILAAITLLTLSLNAQQLKVDQNGNVVQPTAKTEKGSMKAPNRAAVTGSVTVNENGTETNEYIPVYGYYSERTAKDQMIYTASQLNIPSGSEITSLTFYTSSNNFIFSGGTMKVSLGTTTASAFSSTTALTSTWTQVASFTPSSTSSNQWTINFTTPFTYSGNNLIVQIEHESASTGSSHTYFLGASVSNMSLYSYYSASNLGWTGTLHNFQPKATFSYTTYNDPTIRVSPSSVNLNSIPGGTVTETVNVTGMNLTNGITATISGTDASLFTVSPASLGTTGGTLTISYSPTAIGNHTATLELSSTGADPVNVTLNGECTSDLTICNGTETNKYLPIYGYYYDNYQKNQMIYPENMVSSLAGKNITSMTFYAVDDFNWSGGQVTARLATTTDQSSYTSKVRLQPADMAVVASGFDVPSSGNTWTITFDPPFPYNGGNLVIDMEETSHGSGTGHYSSTNFSFLGVAQTGGGFCSYGSTKQETFSTVYSGGNVENFLPKVTFTFEDNEPRHDLGITLSEPDAVIAGETATITATVTNNGNQTESGYTVTFSDGTTTFSTQTGGTLAHGATATFTATYPTSAAGTVSITANVTCTDDANTDDNSATTSLTVNAQVHDLAIALEAPASIVGGNTATVTATVTNNGNQTENSYTVTITDGTRSTLLNQNVTEALAPGATATFTATYATTEAQIGNTVNFTATVACTGDTESSNDNATASMSIISMPPPENVVATANNENQSATVTWEAPNIPTHIGQVTEDFENTSVFPPFSTGGIDATTHTGAFGDWTLYDATGGCAVYGSKQLNYDNESAPHAWFVFKPSGATADDDYPNAVPHDSYSGAQYLESICPTSSTSAAGVSDHWLISPELSGNAQTISYYVSELTTDYGAETYEIWVSTTDNDPSSFTKLGNTTYNVSVTTWAEQTVDLPAGTKYFAIRHTSNDIFGLLVDDVTYETFVPDVEPVSYNVYLDDVLVGNVDADDPLTYTFNNLTGGNHTVEISAVYEGNIESAKVPATFSIVGKTAAPTISVTPGDAEYTITATAADENAEVILTVNGVEYRGTGSVSATVARGNNDQSVSVSATAQESGLLVSDPATQTVNVPALPITPTPTITYEEYNGYVVVTATGEGTVYLEVDGQFASGEGTVSITVMRSLEDRTVTATATAVDTNHQPSAEATQNVPVPALNGTPAEAKEGLLRMHLLIVDQMKEPIPANNSHPDRYGYVLKWEQPANAQDHKQSGTVEVDIQKTEAQVNGYYTLDQIDADVNIGINHDEGLTMDVLTADVSMFLPGENPDVLYYQMQGKQGAAPALNEDYLTQLQYVKNARKYEEMLETSPNRTHQYPANETYHYYDDSTPIVTGIYNDQTSFITYAPSVSTWGIQRRYFEEDGYDNTYGAPIWKSAVGMVELKSAVHERQHNQWNSVNWTDAGGNACSLYILKDIMAEGYLPHTGISNVEYEPYMFRVFVESKNGKLRPYTVVPQGDGDYDGEHLVAGEGTTTGPLCVWSGYYMDGEVNGMTFSEGTSNVEPTSGQTKYIFTKEKVDRDDISNPWNDFDTIKDPDTGEVIDIVEVNRNKANAMFGALDNLAEIIGTDDQGKPIYATVTEDDLKVFVRFYYVAAGTADGHTLNTRAGGASYPAGYGAESPGKAPSPWTAVDELQYVGEIVSQTYYNVQGMQSDRPFEGVNIIVTRYSDGSTSVSKVVK